MNRKERRALQREVGQENSDALAKQVALFGKLPEECMACHKPFDKKDREMVSLWSVVVRQEVVRLFCPECIDTAKGVIENASD